MSLRHIKTVAALAGAFITAGKPLPWLDLQRFIDAYGYPAPKWGVFAKNFLNPMQVAAIDGAAIPSSLIDPTRNTQQSFLPRLR